MRHQLAALALAPVLIAQGLQVRRVTPRLPEPPGPRSGTAGGGPPLRLLIAGDSAAAVIARLEAAAAEPYDVALLSVGVNDVTAFTPVGKWLAQQTRLVVLLKSRFGVQHVLLTGLPPMHAVPALPEPLRWYLGARARLLNEGLVGLAAADEACEVVAPRLPTAFIPAPRRTSSGAAARQKLSGAGYPGGRLGLKLPHSSRESSA